MYYEAIEVFAKDTMKRHMDDLFFNFARLAMNIFNLKLF